MARGAVVVAAILLMLRAARAHYTPTWAVHVPGGKEAADSVAVDHGFINLGEVTCSVNITLQYIAYNAARILLVGVASLFENSQESLTLLGEDWPAN
ncbi:unnamed protein product [Leptidea sinapis]|uniref:Peptidase S8 pro-domain domain-containing protein n=1 Tax=Leptidea sinapis TaxID=189913 RepID=A0A5E4QXW7_9NEOP|nr:unnamed protein product [Leptidea sinapis]